VCPLHDPDGRDARATALMTPNESSLL
jgi:hypothetical protein